MLCGPCVTWCFLRIGCVRKQFLWSWQCLQWLALFVVIIFTVSPYLFWLIGACQKKVFTGSAYSADSEPSVQEQALGLVCNFVDGCMDCVEFAFAEDGIILDAVGRQLWKFSKMEIGVQVRNNFWYWSDIVASYSLQ